MQIEIYADVVFIINFIMDFIIFWITKIICKKKISLIWLIVGSVFASLVFCIFFFIPKLNSFINSFTTLLLLIISLIITFRPKNFKELLKYVIVANIVAFAVGGGSIALFYFTNVQNAIANISNFTVNNFSVKILLASISFFYIITKLFIKQFRSLLLSKQTYYKIKIYMDNNFIALNALVDTGNSLNDPISKFPVVIAEFEHIKDILPDSIKVMFYEKKEDNLSTIISSVETGNFQGRIRLIPFSSVGEKNGVLLGFRPDKLEININDKVVVTKEVIIAIFNNKLSSSDAYEALLNPELF